MYSRYWTPSQLFLSLVYISIYIKRESWLGGHGVPADCSAVCGPIWVKLWWMDG